MVKKSGLGLAVSTLRSPDFEILNDAQKTIFEWVKEGNADRVNDLLFNQDANQLDEEVNSMVTFSKCLTDGVVV